MKKGQTLSVAIIVILIILFIIAYQFFVVHANRGKYAATNAVRSQHQAYQECIHSHHDDASACNKYLKSSDEK